MTKSETTEEQRRERPDKLSHIAAFTTIINRERVRRQSKTTGQKKNGFFAK